MKIKYVLSGTFLLFCFIGLKPTSVNAGGGGRAVITVQSSGVAGGKAAEIVATIYKDNDYKISTDEFGLFRIANAQPGQNCITQNQRSDGEGKIYGSCSSPVSGDMRVYIHFPDKVEDAQAYPVPIVERGAPVPVEPKTISTAAYGPCGSGLTSYGWDPANGKSCPKDHSDTWTAFCGNGYKQHVAIGNCIHANELLSHPEWKAVAEEICNNPRCSLLTTRATVTPQTDTPKSQPTTAPATVRPTPSPKAVIAPTVVPASAEPTPVLVDPTPQPMETVVPTTPVVPVRNPFSFLLGLFRGLWSR